MEYISSNDQRFLAQVEQLIDRQGEVLVLLRYSKAAGSKDFMFFSDGESFRAKLKELAPDTNVIVWGDQQLPLRGKVDDAFIHRALEMIPEGAEYLLLCLEKTVHDFRPHHYWEAFDHRSGETHEELSEALDEYRDRTVAVGLWPRWPEEDESTIEAYVPDHDGQIRPGLY